MTVPLGVRIELYSDEKLHTAYLREDLQAAAAPRAGESFAPGALGQAADPVIDLMPVVHHVEHYVVPPEGTAWPYTGSPLIMAVVRRQDVPVQQAREIEAAMDAEGWSCRMFNN
ncbi:hypothetical protein O2W18_21055 [Modestobacter sp. VKM Ac-2983]|uniref:hypothetical protein n=1 Tax=Modestobacter sp. VKM Ac-2983 TaxID=3004137 RepID=UPI0022AB9B21|nr:hypothetical protein [Modestobacter sp. VKM Ac-2983]MCZ2807602.1 hypothetical protein [Modestobacter sp. VKM Ac-2983]